MVIIQLQSYLSLLILLSLPVLSLSASDAESQKWNSPVLLTKSNLFRQGSVIGFPDISFNLGSYFLKHFDQKCFRGKSESHEELVQQTGRINTQVHDYVQKILGDTELAGKIEKVGVLVNQTNIIYKKLKETKEVEVDENFRKLHSITKDFEKEFFKEEKSSKKDALFNQLISKMNLNAINQKCEVHAASLAIGTGFLISSLIALLQMARIELFLFKQAKYTEFWKDIKPLFENYMVYAAATVRIIAQNGTTDTFTCNKKPELLKTSHSIFVGKVEATKGK